MENWTVKNSGPVLTAEFDPRVLIAQLKKTAWFSVLSSPAVTVMKDDKEMLPIYQQEGDTSTGKEMASNH